MFNSDKWLLLLSVLQELLGSSVKTWLAKVLVDGAIVMSL